MPAEAKGTGTKAAKAFARHYIAAFNFATATGNTKLVRRLSKAHCASCSAMASRIEEVYRQGGHFEGDGWKVLSVKYQPFQPKKRPVLSVGIRVTPQVLVESTGAHPRRFDGGRNLLTIRLVWSASGWKVLEVGRLS
jgi:hypothetical protein